ncbi:NADH-quinone oxidoreductase subunit C [Streptomyces gamaensis]|uniref:NADH-quinone oxidoreductase subunit C n=1 Tax=Streptomyces gamaensis TaxID=1763542 RepID=A0ABW0YZL1_9ACTN
MSDATRPEGNGAGAEAPGPAGAPGPGRTPVPPEASGAAASGGGRPDAPGGDAAGPAGEAVGWLPASAGELFGDGASAALAYDLLTVDVPAERWTAALRTARDTLGCTFFDWLSAVDEPGTGFRVCAHLAALPSGDVRTVRRLVVRTTVPHDAPVLPTAVGVYAGAAWHERETHEMFGIGFAGHPHLVPLLLPESFEGHPLRKDFVLAARVVKAWPGAKEPGESEHGGPKRRQMLPPGVPDPNEWGPLKGQLPPAPARPARTARAAGTATGERPRRTRTAAAGSASQQTEGAAPAEGAPPARPRRTRSASQGSASQQEQPAAQPQPRPRPAPRSADAPWHHARPAFDDESPERRPAAPGEPEPGQPGTGGPAPQADRPHGGKPETPDPEHPEHPDPAGGDTA